MPILACSNGNIEVPEEVFDLHNAIMTVLILEHGNDYIKQTKSPKDYNDTTQYMFYFPKNSDNHLFHITYYEKYGSLFNVEVVSLFKHYGKVHKTSEASSKHWDEKLKWLLKEISRQ